MIERMCGRCEDERDSLKSRLIHSQRQTEETLRAVEFAIAAHGDQKRKYTGEPYVLHLMEVMHTLRAWFPEDTSLHCAGLLHDILEDTKVTEVELRAEFGDEVTDLVVQVTDVSTAKDGNRAARKELDRQHLENACGRAQNLKLADMLSNTKSIAEHDVKFASVYLPEKLAVLKSLTRCDTELRKQLLDVLNRQLATLRECDQPRR